VDSWLWEHSGSGARTTRRGGNHRTEVTEATEEEFGGWWLVALWKHSGSRARTTRREGNHRTEVTGEELGLLGFPHSVTPATPELLPRYFPLARITSGC
jgi:hypothetical protein